MRPSDEKLRAVVHAAARALEQSPQVQVRDAQQVLDLLRASVQEVMQLHDQVQAAARERIASLSRPVPPGSREYQQLLQQYSEEQRRRLGL